MAALQNYYVGKLPIPRGRKRVQPPLSKASEDFYDELMEVDWPSIRDVNKKEKIRLTKTKSIAHSDNTSKYSKAKKVPKINALKLTHTLEPFSDESADEQQFSTPRGSADFPSELVTSPIAKEAANEHEDVRSNSISSKNSPANPNSELRISFSTKFCPPEVCYQCKCEGNPTSAKGDTQESELSNMKIIFCGQDSSSASFVVPLVSWNNTSSAEKSEPIRLSVQKLPDTPSKSQEDVHESHKDTTPELSKSSNSTVSTKCIPQQINTHDFEALSESSKPADKEAGEKHKAYKIDHNTRSYISDEYSFDESSDMRALRLEQQLLEQSQRLSALEQEFLAKLSNQQKDTSHAAVSATNETSCGQYDQIIASSEAETEKPCSEVIYLLKNIFEVLQNIKDDWGHSGTFSQPELHDPVAVIENITSDHSVDTKATDPAWLSTPELENPSDDFQPQTLEIPERDASFEEEPLSNTTTTLAKRLIPFDMDLLRENYFNEVNCAKHTSTASVQCSLCDENSPEEIACEETNAYDPQQLFSNAIAVQTSDDDNTIFQKHQEFKEGQQQTRKGRHFLYYSDFETPTLYKDAELLTDDGDFEQLAQNDFPSEDEKHEVPMKSKGSETTSNRPIEALSSRINNDDYNIKMSVSPRMLHLTGKSEGTVLSVKDSPLPQKPLLMKNEGSKPQMCNEDRFNQAERLLLEKNQICQNVTSFPQTMQTPNQIVQLRSHISRLSGQGNDISHGPIIQQVSTAPKAISILKGTPYISRGSDQNRNSFVEENHVCQQTSCNHSFMGMIPSETNANRYATHFTSKDSQKSEAASRSDGFLDLIEQFQNIQNLAVGSRHSDTRPDDDNNKARSKDTTLANFHTQATTSSPDQQRLRIKENEKHFVTSLLNDLKKIKEMRLKRTQNPFMDIDNSSKHTASSCELSYPVTIESVKIVADNSLYVKWKVDDAHNIAGYEMFLDGLLTNRYFSKIHRAGIITNIDLLLPHRIFVRAMPQKNSNNTSGHGPEAISQQPDGTLWYPSVYYYEPPPSLCYIKSDT